MDFSGAVRMGASSAGKGGRAAPEGVGRCRACRMTAPAGGCPGRVQARCRTRNVPEATRRHGAQTEGGGSRESVVGSLGEEKKTGLTRTHRGAENSGNLSPEALKPVV